MNRDSKRPVTLEDLLQLKRAERPPAEFWTRFERDLRAKQLAALVEKRPWWRSMPRLFAGFSRYHLPIGATAVVAITFLSVRTYNGAMPSAPEAVRQSAPAIVAASGITPAIPVVSAGSSVEPSGVAAALNETSAVATTADATLNVAAGPVTQAITILDNRGLDLDTPSARAIANNRATAQVIDPELSNRFLASAHGFETRALPARQPVVEPLAQMSITDGRRSRLIATAVPVAFNAASPASSEKIARRISDERLYDTVSRFGAKGDRLNVKF